MFEQSLRNAVLNYLCNKNSEQEREVVAESLMLMQQKREAFELRKQKMIKEIENGTRRSNGKLPV